MLKLLRFFNTLNFDTAFGAVSFLLIISNFRTVEISLSVYLALFISVLSIYNIDHLIDALKLNDTSKTYRHSYYQKHFKRLVFWQLILSLLGIATLFYLPLHVLWAGFSLLFIIGIYFLVIFTFTKINLILRELIVALGYTFAVAFVPFFSSSLSIDASFVGMLFVIFLIALTNLWIFSLYDIEIDNHQNHHSIARSVDTVRLQNIVRWLIIFVLIVIFAFTFFYEQWVLGASLLLVEATYLILLEKQLFFSKNELYRLIGESVLILPGIILMVFNAV